MIVTSVVPDEELPSSYVNESIDEDEAIEGKPLSFSD